jgi:hypothetical protein
LLILSDGIDIYIYTHTCVLLFLQTITEPFLRANPKVMHMQYGTPLSET